MALSAFYRVGLIVAIQCTAIIQQVAVVIPGVGLTVDAGQVIGCIIDVVRDLRRRDGRRLLGAAIALPVVCRVAYRIVGIGEGVGVIT